MFYFNDPSIVLLFFSVSCFLKTDLVLLFIWLLQFNFLTQISKIAFCLCLQNLPARATSLSSSLRKSVFLQEVQTVSDFDYIGFLERLRTSYSTDSTRTRIHNGGFSFFFCQSLTSTNKKKTIYH